MSWNSWTKQQVELLIEEYKQHPILYAIKNKYYHNRKLRGIAVNEILKKIKKLRPETQESEILKKVNGLRTNYVTERKKQLNSIKDINCDSEIYQPSLWYYDSLSFLNDNIILRERDSEDSKKTPQIDNTDNCSDEFASRSFSTDPLSLSEADVETESKFSYDMEPKKKRESTETDELSSVKISSSEARFSNDPDDNGWLRYLSTLLGQIKDSQNKVLLRHRITKLMYEEIEKQFVNNVE